EECPDAARVPPKTVADQRLLGSRVRFKRVPAERSLNERMIEAQAEETRIDWEAALVQRACSGDSRAVERLYREHVGRVYGLCLRMTRDQQLAEDCTQETCINRRRALSTWETRGALPTWMTTHAR